MSASFLNYFIIYNSQNYKSEKYKDFKEFKSYLSSESNKSFIILDNLGNEYDQDTINKIKFDINNNQKAKYIIFYYNNKKVDEYLFNQSTADDILLNQIEVDKILSQYLETKKNNLKISKQVCDEILSRYEEFKDDKDNIIEFVENYEHKFENDKECKKYMDMIKNSPKEIENLSPKFKDMLESDVVPVYEEIMNKIEKIIKIEIKGKPNIKSFEDKKLLFEENNKIIKLKLLKTINEQELLYSIQTKLNEVLISGEKINFFLNLSEIPNMYHQISEQNLKAEYKRRNRFNYLYDQIMNFVESELIGREYEYRKKFIKNNFKFTNKLKMEKKTISIFNKLIDYEAQQTFKPNNDLYKSIYDMPDNLRLSIDELIEYLSKISEEIFSKPKKFINNKIISENQLNNMNEDKNINNNKFSHQFGEIKKILKSSSVPELSQNKIISIIESKIINQNQNNSPKLINKNSSEDILLSGWDYSIQEKDNNTEINQQQLNKMVQSFSDTYDKFLWFYEKVFNYLKIYNSNYDHKDIELDKKEPYTLNNYLIEILNENKTLKEKLKQLEDIVK